MIVKSEEISNPAHGRYPGSRSIKEHIDNGFVVVDKPSGPTSHQVAAWVRDMLSLSKAGHSGTLDPKVTGLLTITLGNGTKIMPALMGMDKEYIALMLLHKDVPQEKIREVFKKFEGEIMQRPPKKSAVKRVVRKREIYELEILEIEGREVLFRVLCEAGTYIRKLIDDMGALIGGAHMKELRRVKVGHFAERDLITLHDLKDALEENNEEALTNLIKPIEEGVGHLSKIILKDSATDAVCHGAPLSVGGIAKLDEGIEKDELVAMMSGKGELVAIGLSKMTSEEMSRDRRGVAIKTDRVLMTRGTYPSTWKESKKF